MALKDIVGDVVLHDPAMAPYREVSSSATASLSAWKKITIGLWAIDCTGCGRKAMMPAY